MRLLFVLISYSIAFGCVAGYVRDDCFCGVANTEARRIVNGVMAKPFKYPWMVVLFNGHKAPYCGGVLVSDSHVLTAAHCISFSPRHENYWLKLYGKIKSFHVMEGQSMNFDKVTIHPKFKSYKQYDDYDLAMLTFKKNIKMFSLAVQPICIPEIGQRMNYENKTGIIAGWGTINPSVMKMSPVLMEGKVKILPRRKCPEYTSFYNIFNSESMLCARSINGVDSCQGDSGGPLMVESSHKTFEVVAISSFGNGCGGNHASVYADITQSLPWIWRIINATGICLRPKNPVI